MPVIILLHRVDPVLQLAPLDSSQPHGFALARARHNTAHYHYMVVGNIPHRPQPREKLQAFYDHVRPAAFGWKPFAPPAASREKTLRTNFLHWLLGFSLVYEVLFGHIALGAGQIVLVCACGAVLFWNLDRLNWTVFK